MIPTATGLLILALGTAPAAEVQPDTLAAFRAVAIAWRASDVAVDSANQVNCREAQQSCRLLRDSRPPMRWVASAGDSALAAMLALELPATFLGVAEERPICSPAADYRARVSISGLSAESGLVRVHLECRDPASQLAPPSVVMMRGFALRVVDGRWEATQIEHVVT